MFSQHPFTLEHRYSLGASPALPAWKRALDLVCCIAALPLFGFLTLVFALITKVCSRGPIFYRRQHAGYMGRNFGAYRFRTMRVVSPTGVQQVSGANSTPKPSDASSLIPGGRFLRVSGLADLPQIVNVLRGEMSIVGPRPCVAAESSLGGGQRNDVVAVPGLTGLWRLAAESPATHDESVRWERTYAGHMSFGADLKVIARTVFAIIGLRRGR